MTVVFVALGGGIGAMGRWFIGSALPPRRDGFPVATTVVNVVGSFALGIVLGLANAGKVFVSVEPIAVGVLGGFTTFSTWMVDIDRAPSARSATLITVLPLALGLLGAASGLWLGARFGGG